MIDKAQRAADFIVTHCPHVGLFDGSGEPFGFLQETAKDIHAAGPSRVFPGRYFEHVAYAVDTVARNFFTSPPAAVASVYLVTRFEFYFRILSGRLNGDGTWISPLEQQQALSMISGDSRLNRQKVSSVSLAYQLMKLGSSRVVAYCGWLDRVLYPSQTMAGGTFPISDLGDRIAYGRHGVGHGHRGDISAEAAFYGLVTAIVFYAQ